MQPTQRSGTSQPDFEISAPKSVWEFSLDLQSDEIMTKIHKSEPEKWSSSDETSLLAWLDHTLKHKNLNFERTVVKQLKDKFTWNKIKSKLWRLWNKLAANAPDGMSRRQWGKENSIFHHGSSSLIGLSQNEKQAIGSALQILEDQYIATQLFSSSHRHLRSSSKADGNSSIPSRGGLSRTASRRASSTSTHQCPASSLTPSVSKKNRLDFEHAPLGEIVPSKKRKALHNILISPSGKETPLKTYSKRQKAHPPRTGPSSSLPIVIDDTDDADTQSSLSTLSNNTTKATEHDHYDLLEKTGNQFPSSASGTQSSIINGAAPTVEIKTKCANGLISKEEAKIEFEDSCNGCQVLRPARLLKHFCESCFSKQKPQIAIRPTTTDTSVQTEVLSKDTRLESAISEIRSLQEQLSEKEDSLNVEHEAIKAKDREISALVTTATQRDAQDSWPREKVLASHLQEVGDLNQKLDMRRYWGTFTDLNSRSRQRFSTKSLDKCFLDIYSYVKDIPIRSAADHLSLGLSLEQHIGLRDPVHGLRATAGIDQTYLGDTQAKLTRLCQYSPKVIVRALTSIALREWIFETDFPHFDAGTSEILGTYRTLLLQQDGPVALRNLDLASLVTLVRNDSLQKTAIPKKASELAIKLSQNLAPLFSDTPHKISETNWDGFSTWRDEKEIFRERQRHFNEMFSEALKTKAELCLNIEDYEMVVFPPGTRYDKNTMTVETRDGVRCGGDNFEGAVVELCIQAAVYSYPRKEPSRTSSVAEVVVTTRNFVRKAARERAAIRPLVKAVVVLCTRK